MEHAARPNVSLEETLDLYRSALRIRASEAALAKLFSAGEIPGFIHLSFGQEATAAGVCAALKPADTLATTHRGHGHVIARGMDIGRFFKELMGRAGGQCGGRSGSMHVADMSLGILGANGIVGASLPLALGSALSHQTRRTDACAVAFFGDGAMAEGALHEAFNMAALWKLPVIFACENNGWSEFSPTSRQFKPTLAAVASAFSIPHLSVDGNDAIAVLQAARDARDAVMQGPVVLECVTTRVRGHYEGDAQKYRTAEELQSLDARDPIRLLAARLEQAGIAAAEVQKLAADADAEINAAIDAARIDVFPDFDAAFHDVYTPDRTVAHG